MEWPAELCAWVTARRTRRLARETLVQYTRFLERFAVWYESTRGQAFVPSQITVDDADAWLRSELDRGRKPPTVNCYLSAVKLLGEWLAANGQVPSNQLRDLPPIPYERPPRSSWLEPDELVRLYRAVRFMSHWTERYRVMTDAIIRLMTEAGLRLDEVSHLRLEDLVQRSPDRIVLIARSYSSDRRLRVPENVRRALEAWLPIRGDRTSPWVFVGQRNDRLGTRSIDLLVRAVVAKAGLVAVTCQTLRLTYHHNQSIKKMPPDYLKDMGL